MRRLPHKIQMLQPEYKKQSLEDRYKKYEEGLDNLDHRRGSWADREGLYDALTKEFDEIWEEFSKHPAGTFSEEVSSSICAEMLGRSIAERYCK